MFPVGTIIPYAGNLSKIPYGWHVCDGTNGTPDLSERFLEGTTSTPKTFKDAGLPNITGSFAAYDNGNWLGVGFGEIMNWGAIRSRNQFFASLDNVFGGFTEGNGHTKDEVVNWAKSLSKYGYEVEAENWMDVNASWSSPVYGNSDTVQPKSYTVYYIMRVK